MKAFLLSTAYMLELRNAIAHNKTDKQLFSKIVNAPFSTTTKGMPLGLGLIVLVLVNQETNTVDRIALSDTEPARGAVDFSVKAFNQINIPMTQKENLLVKAIVKNSWQETEDLKDTFIPVLSPTEARFNQAGAGVGSTVIYPLNARERGALSFSYVIPLKDISDMHHKFMKSYADIVDRVLSKSSTEQIR